MIGFELERQSRKKICYPGTMPPKWHAGLSLFLAVLLMLPQSAFGDDRRSESAEDRATAPPSSTLS
jgi:hypothetical protein